MEILVGNTRLNYSVTRSANVKKRRISLTPDTLEVIVPMDATEAEVNEFVRSRVEWIRENVEVLRNTNPLRPWPEKFVSNAKVLYHGRYIPVTLHFAPTNDVTITLQNERFTVRAPFEVAFNDRDVIMQEAFREFHAQDLRKTLGSIINRFARRIDIHTPNFHVGEVEDGLGYFNERGEPVFTTALILAPTFALEYVVLHELCAMKIRTRGPEFWSYLESVMPDYRLRAEWVREHRPELTSGQI